MRLLSETVVFHSAAGRVGLLLPAHPVIAILCEKIPSQLSVLSLRAGVRHRPAGAFSCCSPIGDVCRLIWLALFNAVKNRLFSGSVQASGQVELTSTGSEGGSCGRLSPRRVWAMSAWVGLSVGRWRSSTLGGGIQTLDAE